MPDLTTALREHIAGDFGPQCVGHSLDHLDRVASLGLELHEKEGGDRVVIQAASYLHDYHRVAEVEGVDDPVELEQRIRGALDAVSFPATRVETVLECIAFTDRYSFAGHGLAAPSLEARIVRDADNLDALGAVGIARAFMFGASLGEPLWVEGVTPETTYRSGPTSSVLHHFFEKLLRVRDDMLTPTGRLLAEDRHDYMLGFLAQLQSEWNAPGLRAEFAQHTAAANPTAS